MFAHFCLTADLERLRETESNVIKPSMVPLKFLGLDDKTLPLQCCSEMNHQVTWQQLC